MMMLIGCFMALVMCCSAANPTGNYVCAVTSTSGGGNAQYFTPAVNLVSGSIYHINYCMVGTTNTYGVSYYMALLGVTSTYQWVVWPLATTPALNSVCGQLDFTAGATEQLGCQVLGMNAVTSAVWVTLSITTVNRYFTGDTNVVYVAGSAVSATAAGILDINVKNVGASAVSATIGLLDINTKNIGGSAVSATSGLLDTNLKNIGGSAVSSTSGLLDTNLKNVGGSAVSATGGLLDSNIKNVGGSAISQSGGVIAVTSGVAVVSPVYSSTATTSAFPSQYLTPLFRHPLSQSMNFHACVNATGNYDSGPVILAPNGTCGGDVSVSVTVQTTTTGAVTTAGLKLSGVEQLVATVVGSGSHTAQNVFMDVCVAQADSFFLNTTMASGTTCVDISFSANNGLLPASGSPAYIAPWSSGERPGLGVMPGIGGWTCQQFSNPVEIVCGALVASNSPIAALSIGAGIFSVDGQITCSGLSASGIYMCLVATTNGGGFNPTNPNLCAIVSSGIPSARLFGPLETSSLYSYIDFCTTSPSSLVCQGLVTGATCYLNVVLTDGSAAQPTTLSPFYQTSYAGGPPQAYYYDLASSSPTVSVEGKMMRKRK